MNKLIAYLLLTWGLLSAEESQPYLYSLKGTYTHPIHSKSPLAQQYFDQGMVFFYGYNFDEAARSFQAAANLDPDCAICYWGIAIASRGNLETIEAPRIPRAMESARKAQELMGNASPQEKAYIQALVNSYLPNSHSLKDLDLAFAREMKEVAKQYPKDADAASLYAGTFINISKDPQKVIEVLKAALVLDPNHPGSNHYYIHALDAASQHKDGVNSAKVLETLIPFAGHLLHMPAHIYFNLGRYHDATLANQRATQADEELFANGGIKSYYYSSFYLHSYQFLIASLIMEGKEKEALQVAEKLGSILKTTDAEPSLYMQNALAAQRLIILQRFDDWQPILKEPNPGTPLGNGMWHFSRSLAFLAQNDLTQAKSEASAIESEKVDPSEETLNALLKILSLHAQAAIQEKEGDLVQMRQSYQEAMKLEEQVAYMEPPLWLNSSREALGMALLRAGNRKEAAKLFQEDLKMHPNKIWSLNGLKQSQ